MSERKVETSSSFKESLSALNEQFGKRLKALKSYPLLPNLERPLILTEWHQLDRLIELIAVTPSTDPRYQFLDSISREENYYVFVHSIFRAYFVLDISLNNLVGLLIRRSDNDRGDDLLESLQKALELYIEKRSR